MSSFKECVVPTCSNNTINAPKKIYLWMPKDERRTRWFKAIIEGTGTEIKWQRGKNYNVCEDHFNLELDSENWMQYKLIETKLFLKKDVVPHIFHVQDKPQITSSEKKRKAEIIHHFHAKKPKYVRTLFSHGSEPQAHCSKDIIESPSGKFVSSPYKETYVHNQVHVGIQVSPPKGIAVGVNTKISGSVDASETSSTTGSTSSFQRGTASSVFYPGTSDTTSEVLSDIDERRRHYVLHNIEKYPRFYLGLPKAASYIVKLLSNEIKCPMIHIMITLQKLRLSDSLFRLGVDFKFSAGHVSKIVNNMVPKMAHLLKQLIVWPDKKKILRNLPIQFRYKYKNVQSIIDCYEVELQKPTNANLQAATWSSYKNCNTMKYLISATPDGFINYVSEGFGGRTSDVAIVKNCSYLDAVPENCTVMADRGFKEIATLLATKNCKLVRPPSVSVGQQLSKSLARESKKIASCRVHIERVIRRVREFHSAELHSQVNIKNVYMLDDVMYIICGLVNLQKRLIKH